jgi:hypothetical protein
LVTRPARELIGDLIGRLNDLANGSDHQPAELIKTDIRQSPALPGFLLRGRIVSLPAGDPRVMLSP